MKTFLKVAGLWLAVVAVGMAADSTKRTNWRALAAPTHASRFCDPVCELRSQDAAFCLLMEVFREHQSYRIETDYQIRLEGIAAIGSDKTDFFIETDTPGLKMLRQYIYGLAKKERELRTVKLDTEVANLRAAYSCVRKIDEDYVGQKVPKNLDPQAAQAQIKELVILAPGTLAKGDATHARSIPAGIVLLNTPPGPVDEANLIEPCD